MINLAIGRLDLPEEQAWLTLSGSTVMDGLISSEYQFQPSQEETTQETVFLHLRGSREQLRQWLDRLEKFQQQSQELFLRLWSEDHQRYGYARIHHFNLDTFPGHLTSHERGSIELALNMLRETLFFSDELPLPLSNDSGLRQESGLLLCNHNDSTLSHNRWFRVDANELYLNFPALTRFQFQNNFNGPDLGDFYVGSLPCMLGQPRPELTLEAEDGIGGAIVSHSQASGGKYCQYRWSGADWQTLASWILGPIEVSQLTEGTILPLLRFFNAPQSSALQLRMLINLQGKLVFEGPVTYAASGVGFSKLDPLHLPLGELPLDSFASHHQLVLQAKQTDLGEHLLELDDMLLLPQYAFAGYHSLSGLSYLNKLIEDEISGKSWSLQDGLEFKSHNRIGSGLRLNPSNPQYFWCFQTDVDLEAPIDRTLWVRGWFRKQWRLP